MTQFNLHQFHKLCLFYLAGLENITKIPDLHYELLDLYQKDTRQLCVVCPVGFAKSTTLKNYGIFDLLTNTKTHFVVYVSSTYTKSVDQLTAVSKILKQPTVQKLYGYKLISASQTDITINVNGVNKCIKAIASGGDILGIQFEGHRPTLILVDDIEELEQARSQTRTDQLNDWLETSLISRLPSLTTGKIIMIGTNLSKISIINQILTKKIRGWEYHKYTCYNPATQMSWWEERHSTVALKKMETDKPFVFARNYLNDPVDTSSGIIKPEHLRYFDLENMPEILEAVMHYDLTHTAKTSSDYSCVGIIGKGIDNNFYVIDWHLSKELDPLAQANFALQFYLKYYKRFRISKFSFDANGNDGFGQFARELARQKDISLPLEPKKYNSDKVQHLTNHQSHFVGGRVFLNSNHQQLDIATEQLVTFPTSKNDDFIDFITGAMDNIIYSYQPKTKEEMRQLQQNLREKRS
jgi:phage terminase large subunit-like protein